MKFSTLKKFFFFTLIITAAALLSGCSGAPAGQSEPGGDSAELVIISPHWEGIRIEFNRAFKQWYAAQGKGDVEITWLDQGGTSDDVRFIRSGFSRNPETIDVDILYGGGIDPYIEFAKEGLLVPFKLPDDVVSKLPKSVGGIPVYDEQYRWYGASLAGFGILYNKKLLDMYGLDAPAAWIDLAKPGFRGLVGSSDPRHSGSMHMMYEIILQAYGWDEGWRILLGMGANVRNFPKSSTQTGKDLQTGEIAAGLSIDTYAFSAIEEVGAKRLGFILPQQATVITPDPIAILKGAPNIEVAQDFIRFSLSPEGQKIWMYRKGEAGGPVEFSLNKMSVLPELYETDFRAVSNITVNPFEYRKGFSYDFAKGAERWTLLNDMVGALIIDVHDDLAAAAEKFAGDGEKLAAAFAPPVSEDQAMKLTRESWSDEVERNRVINKWLDYARKNYRAK